MYVSCISGSKYLRLLSFTLNVPLAGIQGFCCGMWGWFSCWSKQDPDGIPYFSKLDAAG